MATSGEGFLLLLLSTLTSLILHGLLIFLSVIGSLRRVLLSVIGSLWQVLYKPSLNNLSFRGSIEGIPCSVRLRSRCCSTFHSTTFFKVLQKISRSRFTHSTQVCDQLVFSHIGTIADDLQNVRFFVKLDLNLELGLTLNTIRISYGHETDLFSAFDAFQLTISKYLFLCIKQLIIMSINLESLNKYLSTLATTFFLLQNAEIRKNNHQNSQQLGSHHEYPQQFVQTDEQMSIQRSQYRIKTNLTVKVIQLTNYIPRINIIKERIQMNIQDKWVKHCSQLNLF